jgi:hypothetical protein
MNCKIKRDTYSVFSLLGCVVDACYVRFGDLCFYCNFGALLIHMYRKNPVNPIVVTIQLGLFLCDLLRMPLIISRE